MPGLACAVTVFNYALRFFHRFGREPAIRRRLDETEPIRSLPEKTFDGIYDSVGNSHNVEFCLEIQAWFEENHRQRLAMGIWPRQDFSWPDRRIHQAWEYMRSKGVSLPAA